MMCHVDGLHLKSSSEFNFFPEESRYTRFCHSRSCVLSSGVNTFTSAMGMPVDYEDQGMRRAVKCGSAVLSVEEN